MENLPYNISIIFFLTTCLAALLFYKASNYSRIYILIALGWLIIQAGVASSGFYTITTYFPPRLIFLLLPPLLLITTLFTTSRGRQYIDQLDSRTLTLLHIVRIPVELVLYWLFLNNVVPELMTFEGRNFDILAGLTAPIIHYLGLVKNRLNKSTLLAWNLICLGLLVNIITNGILSVPSAFQKLAFDQPNVALLYFPFVWLPGFIVPVVLFSHVANIRQLLLKRTNTAS